MRKILTTFLFSSIVVGGLNASEGGMCGAKMLTGFYGGLELGIAQTSDKFESYTTANGATHGGIQSDNGKAGGLFGLFLGYGFGIGSCGYVGAEIYGGGDTTKFDIKQGERINADTSYWSKTNMKHNMYYGLAVRAGMLITPSTLIYLRLGVEGGKWKGTYEASPQSVANMNVLATHKHFNKNSVSFAPGIGVETYVNQHFFVRLEYKYTFVPKLNMTQAVGSAHNPDYGKVVQRHKLGQHAVKIGFGYKF